MKRWKTAVLITLLVTVATLAGAIFFARSRVKNVLEEAITSAAPLAQVQYSNVGVSLGGKIRIYDIEIRPRIIEESLRVEGIDIETPGLWYLLTMRKGEFPEQLRVIVRGLALGIGGAITNALDGFIATAAQSGGAKPVSNCGDLQYFDLKAYRRLGYNAFVFDLSAGYRVEQRNLRVNAEWRTRDLGTVTMELEFAGAPGTLNEILASQPRVRAFTVSYQDLSFTEKLKRYCAQASGVTVEQYIEAEIDRSDAIYQAAWGFIPGPGLRAAYRDFLTHPGEIRLQGTPSGDTDMRALALYKPEDVVSMLNLRLNVNGKPVSDLSMTTPPAAANDAVHDPANPLAAPAVSGPTVTPVTAALTPSPAVLSVVPTRELNRYLNKTVRLTLTRGTVREGRLLQILDGMARVERRHQGGTMTLAIPLQEIERAEVER